MQQFIIDLEKQMQQQLLTATLQSSNERQQINRSIQITNLFMQKLKDYIVTYQFKSTDEEIDFFKVIKPKFQKQALYWVELAAIDTNDYSVSNKDKIVYYKQVIENMKGFFSKGTNNLFYIYYKQGHNHEDDQLFLRATDCTPLEAEYTLDFDNRFCTANSSKFARFMAYEMVIDHLLGKIAILKNKGAESPRNNELPHLVWSSGPTDLTELGRALYANGSVNNGNASIKDIMTVLQASFNTQAGNHYRIYNDMLLRKKDLTPFLNKLAGNLSDKMKEDCQR